ncbi:protein FAR1-RELATED SEQUENCE 5-like isoform X1 [Primulina eburnea]|uniref:protein FAR1-RELATED SEQUENCE 5-like isoform X1 n=1 Tax=Primulina eburnea TaxID=1245227 RepID=UPI003C6C66DF
MDFTTRFNRALRHQRHNELVADHIDLNECLKIKSKRPMETQMVKVYTKIKWLEFQSEMNESDGYFLQQTSEGVELAVYNVMNFQSCSSSKPRVLTHNKLMDSISCSCMKFEFDGILCRHMLAFFRISQVYQLPDKYILKRWTRVAKVDAIYFMTEQNSIDDPEKSLMSRHSRLSYKASVAIDDASLTDEGTNFLDKQLDYILSKIKEINTSKTFNSESQKKRTMDVVLGIIDPSEIRAKGCGKRLKSSKEKSISKARLCRGCGSRGVSHDQRNCPISHNGSTIHDHDNNDDNINEEEFASMTGSNNMRTTGTQLD